jgi:hypothetical protein
VELGEPYAYAHWLGQRGILAVRNPSNESKRYVLDLGKAGAPGDLEDAICYTQYPYRRGIAAGLKRGSQVPLGLAPWELLLLEIVPRAQLREAVALGARWYRGADGMMSLAPDPAVESERVLEPGGKERAFPAGARSVQAFSGSVLSRTVRQVPKPEWLAAKPTTVPLFPFRYPAAFNTETLAQLKETEWKGIRSKEVPTVAFELECSVSVPPQASSAKVLLLVEFPGRSQYPSRCKAWLDGRQVALEERSSAEHIGYYNWTGRLRPFESDWCWYLCNVDRGSHRVKFQGTAGHSGPRLGLWAWTDRDLAETMQRAPVPCADPDMPQYRDRIERQGVCLLPPAAR